jgi:hypothetical protein
MIQGPLPASCSNRLAFLYLRTQKEALSGHPAYFGVVNVAHPACSINDVFRSVQALFLV